MLIANSALLVVDWGRDTPAGPTPLGAYVGYTLAFVAYPAVGALIVFRRPGNRIGWLFLVTGLVLEAGALAPAYATHGTFVSPHSLPGAQWAAWFSAWLDGLFILGLALLLLLFPDGFVPTRRWRPALWLVLSGTAVLVVDSALKPGPIRKDLPIENPLGIGGAAGLFAALDTAVWLLFVVSFVVSVAALVTRFIHANGEVRAQIKWIVGAALLLVLAFAADIITVGVLGRGQSISDAIFGLGFAGVPLAAGVAILRYRLYEIDRVISRTLVYGGLTVILGAAYAGLVLGGQALFSSFAGGSHLAVAVSTLVVAALFLPLRARVQKFVDRRFYRSRYHAQRTLEAFGARLREQVDLETLIAELSSTVRDTLQPREASVWLRGGTAR